MPIACPCPIRVIEYARSKNKLVLCPFNTGFSGLVICFSKDSASSDQTFDLKKSRLDDHEIAKQLFEKYPEVTTLKQANKSNDAFFENVTKKGHFPQINIGALISTALVLTNIVKFIKGEAIKLAPAISYLDSDPR